MKEKIINFLKNKFNITLIVIQMVALLCCLFSVKKIFYILFFLLEGVFLILLGIKVLQNIGKNNRRREINEKLPYTSQEIERLNKEIESSNKNSKFVGLTLIILGIIIIFSLFSIL